MQSQKRQNDLCSFPRQTIQYHSNPSLYPNQQCWRSWIWTNLWRPTRPFRTNIQKRCPFHYSGLMQNWESRNTWDKANLALDMEWSRANANRVLPRECTGHSKHPFQQHKRRLCTWTSPDGQQRNQIDYILCSQRWRSSIQSAKTRLGDDWASDHELLIAKFRLNLKKVGKTTRPFRLWPKSNPLWLYSGSEK